MALALYRRYRPDTFDGVIGQDQVTIPLMRALDKGKLTHAYLFSGPRGCGKTSSARILARCINCAKGPTSHPCGECPSCKDLATGGPGSIDVVEIDAASHNGVDDARELRERAGFAPARDRYKIFILDEAHMVTQQGFNALLKIVEEPPEHVMFIFATTEPDKVIGTIRSRTHHYPFRLVPQEVMGPYLEQICDKEQIKPEPGVLKLAMRAGGGSVRDTLSVLDQLMVGAVDGVITHDSAVALLGFTPEALIGEAVDAVIDRNGEALYGVVQKVVVGGFDPRRFVEDLLARVRDLLVLTLGGAQAESVLSDAAEAEDMDDLRRQASALGLGALTGMAETINTTLGSMTGAISPRMRLELLAARLLAGRENIGLPQAVGGSPAMQQPAGASSSAASQSSQPSGQSARRGGFIGSTRNRVAETPASGATHDHAGHGPNAAAAGTSSGDVQPAPDTAGAVPQSSAQATADVAGQDGFAAAPAQTASSTAQTSSMAQTSSQQEPGGSPSMASPAHQLASASAATVQPGNAAAGAGAANAQPAASAMVGSAMAGSAQADDTRTIDQRWDDLVKRLPQDVAKYVGRDVVPRVHMELNERTGAGKLWIKFDKALSKYAFAKAVAGEAVDGTTNVVNILRAEVRKEFGDHVQLAPTKRMADGQLAPPLNKLPPEEQQRISAQIAKASLAASLGSLGGVSAGVAKEPKTTGTSDDKTAESASSDEVHRAVSSSDHAADGRLNAPAAGPAAARQPVHQGEDGFAAPLSVDHAAGHAGDGSSPRHANAAENVAMGADVVPARGDAAADGDPWAMPENGDMSPDGNVAASTDSGFAAPASSVGGGRSGSSAGRSPMPQAGHVKHVAVPDMSDDTDPWANEEPAAQSPRNATHAADAAASRVGHAPASGVVGQSGDERFAGRPVGHGGAATTVDDTDDPWANDGTAAQPGPGMQPVPQQQPGRSGQFSGPAHQADPWQSAAPQAGGPQVHAGSSSGWNGNEGNPANGRHPGRAGFASPQADPYAQEDIPVPTVAPEDDEYSMDDVSLGTAKAMSVDDLKRFFEVKKTEEFAADDPKNPRNIQHDKQTEAN